MMRRVVRRIEKHAGVAIATTLVLGGLLALAGLWQHVHEVHAQTSDEQRAIGWLWVRPIGGSFRIAILEADQWQLVPTNPMVIRPREQRARYSVVPYQTGERDGREYLLPDLPRDGTLRVYRNGLRQTELVDYVLQERTLTFFEFYDADPDARVACDYEVAGREKPANSERR